jgi:nitrate/nitrite-specific signal transduction histidine kinase
LKWKITYEAENRSVRVRDNGSEIDLKILSGGREGHCGLSARRGRGQNIGTQLNILSNPASGRKVDLTIPAKVADAQNPKPRPWFRFKRKTSGGR